MLERIKVFLCLEPPQTRKASLTRRSVRGIVFGGEGGGVDLNFERELKFSKKIECGRNIEAMARTKGTFCSGLVSQSKYGNPQVRALARAGLASLRLRQIWPSRVMYPLHYYQVLPTLAHGVYNELSK